MSEDEKRSLVLELFAQDVQAGLNAAVGEKRQEFVWFIENLWGKYYVTLIELQTDRAKSEQLVEQFLSKLSYT